MIHKLHFSKLFLVLATIVVSFFNVIPVSAMPDFYSDSEIQFYDPNACEPGDQSGTTSGASSGAGGSGGGVDYDNSQSADTGYEVSVETDGSDPNPGGDGNHLPETSYGHNLGWKTHFVALNPEWDEIGKNKLKLGDVVKITWKGKTVYAIWGDNHSSGGVHTEVSLSVKKDIGAGSSAATGFGSKSDPVKFTIYPNTHQKIHGEPPEQSLIDQIGTQASGTVATGSSNPNSSGNASCCSDPSLGGASGSVSSRVGYGASEKGKESLQEAVVAAGAAHGMDPNFVASFYYAENSRTGDSTNNADASKGTPVTGDGKWRDPAPPEGEGSAWDPPNAWTAYGPFQFVTTTWQTYKPPGSNDTTDRLNLRKEAWAASKYMKTAGNGRGVTTSTSDGELRRKIFAYNHDNTYVSSVINTYKYLSGRSSTAVSPSSGCASDTNGATGTIVGDLAWPVPVKYTRSNWDWFTKPHHDYPASDIPVPDKTSIYSITDGKVTYAANGAVGAGSNGGFGTVIAIESGGALFRYQHGTSDTLKFKVGDTVKKGDLIMKSGYTGHVVPADSRGSHLHVSIETGDNNPVKRPTNHCPQELFREMKSGEDIKRFKDLPTSGCISGSI